MLKLFRKYLLKKSVLAVVASFLMILFLLPGIDIFTPDPRTRPLGEVNGHVIRHIDQQTARSEMRALQAISPMLLQGIPQDDLTWLLLVHEARQHGIWASGAEVRGALQDLQEAQLDPFQAVARAEVTEDLMIQALRHYLMISDLRDLVMGARRPSEPRMAHFARDTMSAASADVVLVDAEFALDRVEEPGEEEIQSHFEQYRDVRPGESEPYGFGYFLPPRVQLEYLALPLERVKAQIEIDEADAWGYYFDNPELFYPENVEQLLEEGEDIRDFLEDPADPEDVEAPADAEAADAAEDDAEADTEQSAGDPLAAYPQGEPLDYLIVRDLVHRVLLEEQAREIQTQTIRWIAGELTRRDRQLPPDPEAPGYRDTEGYEPEEFERLADRAEQRTEQRHGFSGVRPEVVRHDDRWLGPEDVADLEPFGRAFLDAPERRYPIAQYIFSAREVEPAAEHRLAALGLQVGVASRPVQDAAETQYVFRLIAGEPEREPHDLDEVRDRVVRDMKRLRAFELLREEQDDFLFQAREEGLAAVAERVSTDVLELDGFQGRTYDDLGRMRPPALPGIGRSATFVDAVFRAAQRAYQESENIAEADPELTMLAIAMEGNQALALTRVREYQPVNRELYELLRTRLPVDLQMADMVEMFEERHPFEPEAVQERVGFRRHDTADDDEFDDVPFAQN